MVTLAVLIALASAAREDVESLGAFKRHADIGAPAKEGSAQYDAATGRYRLLGSGTNMWFDRDEFHLASTELDGDFLVTARLNFVGEGVDPHRKAGWIARAGLEADDPYVSAAVHGDGLTSMQFRPAKGANTIEVRSPVVAPDVVQLERRGNKYSLSVARFGEPFTTELIDGLELPRTLHVGLFVCAHNPDVVETAEFRDVRITRPAPANFRPYRDYIGSRLEILDVETGDRRVVHTDDGSIQAPNWTPDGKALIYNKDGRLYRFDLETRTPTAIDTGFATRNNNDHVLSFDGKWIGLSHHSAEDLGKSIVYVVPIGGGEPRRVTAKGPSYLHGWSPDGGTLVYTGERDGALDIYAIGVRGGDETRLTDAEGLDDGSEFTPDGRQILFCSTRTGTMQLWRMNADGSGQTQLTDDDLNNWFPHVSPDGRSIVFLSFLGDVAPDDHPFYRQVYLRRMPIDGGPAQVIAYVYGGQGTINVPSWSPDGKFVAFVSNSIDP
jgi:Tol biopolymer transport system component